MNRAGTGVGRGGGFVLVAVAAVVATAAVTATTAARGEEPAPLKVVVHVNFADEARQGRGLGNVENILKAAVAAKVPAEVVVVCHSDGITLLERAKSKHAARVDALKGRGVRFAACENTMRDRSIGRDDLLPGVGTVPSGAFEVVVRQRDGYTYFKP